MSDSIFDELYTSMKQVEAIAKGEMTPANVTRYELADVKAIRAQLDVSQKELAQAMDVSIDTVKSWEQGRRNPTGLASKVLMLLAKEPGLYAKFAIHWFMLSENIEKRPLEGVFCFKWTRWILLCKSL